MCHPEAWAEVTLFCPKWYIVWNKLHSMSLPIAFPSSDAAIFLS